MRSLKISWSRHASDLNLEYEIFPQDLKIFYIKYFLIEIEIFLLCQEVLEKAVSAVSY